MNNTIAQLISRYGQIGFDLIPTPNTDPQAWTVRDRFTGVVVDFGGPAPNGWGDSFDSVRRFIFHCESVVNLRRERVRVLYEQGKTIDETADILNLTWATVVSIRKLQRLPCKEAWGAKSAWKRRRNSIPEPTRGPRGSKPTAANLEAKRLL